MTDPRVSVYEAYASAWSAVPEDKRLSLLNRCLAKEITFANATKPRAGIGEMAEHLAGFQRNSPGSSFRVVEMLAFDDHVMAMWQLVDSDGKEGFVGHDVMIFGKDDKIRSIVMFSKVGKQIIK